MNKLQNTIKLLIFSAEILAIGFAAGVIAERKRISDQIEKEDVFEQFCEICIDKLDDGEVYYD